jgi:hypothetical protein
MLSWPAEVRKAIGAAIAAGITWATLVVNSPSGPITDLEWLALATAVAGVLAVYGLTNENPPKV